MEGLSHLRQVGWQDGLVASACVVLPWVASRALAASVRSSSAKNWKRNLQVSPLAPLHALSHSLAHCPERAQKPPKPPLWWVLRRVKPLVYCTAGAASLLVWRT